MEEPRDEEFWRVVVFKDLYGNLWDLIGNEESGGCSNPLWQLGEGDQSWARLCSKSTSSTHYDAEKRRLILTNLRRRAAYRTYAL